MRMDQGSPVSSSGSSPSRAAMAESPTSNQPQSPPPPKPQEPTDDVQPPSAAPKNGAIEAILIYNEEGTHSADMMELAVSQDATSLQSSSSAAPQGNHIHEGRANRTGTAFALEDRTPVTEFEEFVVIDEEAHSRHQHVATKVEPFRIVFPIPSTSPNKTSPSPSSSLSAEELTAEANDAAKLVDMKCFICGTVLQLPSYAALQKKCHLKCSSCDTGETHAKNWMDIILTALYNLEILHQRQYFHCKSEICAFIDHHWSSICPERARTPTWGNTVMSQISTHPELFQSHQRGSGYWALKRSSPGDKEFKNRDEEGLEKDVRGGDKRAENKNKRRTDQKVLGEEDDETQVYLIEEILSKRVRRSGVEYYVKWEGLADSENSWEKARDIECPELIQDFESEARKHPLWKEGSGFCLKRKREDLDDKSEKKARRITRKQTKIPVSQWCHQCLRHKPVIMCCDGAATGRCKLQFCERCLEKFYDEEIVVLQKAKGEWMCPVCRGVCCCAACDPARSRARKNAGRSDAEPPISRIIARCRVEGTNEWEYLVHYRGRAETENRWLRASQIDLPAQLKKRYRNTLKMRVNKRREKEPPPMPTPTPEPRPSKTGTPGGRSSRTPKGLRTSDYDISRVVFDDQVHRIFVPEKPEVVTPAWRVVTDAPRESNGDSISVEKIAGVTVLDESATSLRYDDEGSSSEDTSDEAFTRRHSRYETVFPVQAETPSRTRRNSTASGSRKGKKSHKSGRKDGRNRDRMDEGEQPRERRNSRSGSSGNVERRRSDSQLLHYASDDISFPDVMRVEQLSASVDSMDIPSASVPPTPTTATPLTEISAT